MGGRTAQAHCAVYICGGTARPDSGNGFEGTARSTYYVYAHDDAEHCSHVASRTLSDQEGEGHCPVKEGHEGRARGFEWQKGTKGS